jgi:uncharacterized repeat protein (TIGR01451 family)
MFGTYGWRKLVQRFKKMQRRTRPRRSILRVEQLEARLALAAVDLGIDKAAPASVTAGTDITYTLTVTNNGPEDATDVSVNDTVPTGTSFVSVSVTGGTGTTLVSGNDITATFPTLASGDTGFIQLVVLANSSDADGSTITNTATVMPGATDSDDISSNNSSTVNTTVNASADVSITKTGPATVMAGTDVTYSITVTNNGPSDAQNIQTSDVPPPHTSFVSFNGPANGSALADGDSLTYTLIVHVDSDAPDGSTLTNTANVASDTTDNNSANNTATVDSTVVNHADVSITKTGPATITAGTDATYSITVTNNGPVDAQNIQTSDTPPPHTSFVSFNGPANGSTLAVGDSLTYTLVLHVDPDASGGSTLTNTANVTSDTTDNNSANNTATFDSTVNVPQADLALTKTGPATVAAGSQVTYTLSLTNNGPSDAQGVNVADTLPAGETFVSASEGTGSGTSFTDTIGTFANGATRTITIVAQVGAAVAGGTTLHNSAAVSATTSDSNAGNNMPTFDTTVTAPPAADVAVVKVGPATVTSGTLITYTLTVTNGGAASAASVSLTDTLPAGETFVSASEGTGSGASFSDSIGTLAAGATRTITLVARVGSAVAGGTVLHNSATVSTTTSESNSLNNVATFDTTVNAPEADVAITKTGPATATAGTQITYTLSLTNNGPSDAQGVTLVDTLPVGETFVSASEGTGTGTTFSDSIGTLAAGASRTVTLVAAISASASGTLNNAAAVTATTEDANFGNNTATFDTTVTPATVTADLRITKTDGVTTVAPGDSNTYTIVVTNLGPGSVTGATVSDDFPVDFTGVTFVSVASAGATGNTAIGSGDISDTVNMPVGSSITYTVMGTVSPTAFGTLVNTATVTAPAGVDTNTSNNSATDTDLISTPSEGLPTCDITTFNDPGDSGTAVVQDDADNPGSSVLLITGTRFKDVIVVVPQPRHSGMLQVVQNNHVLVTFAPSDVQRIVVFGLQGNDQITISAALQRPAVIFGGAGNDILVGGGGNDQIEGEDGNDTIVGGSGHDVLCGDNGRDVLVGGLGNDTLFGEAGNDVLAGSAGEDLLLGGDGSDVLDGGVGNDRLYGQSGNDTLVGGVGNNVLVGGSGNDRLIARAGRNILIGGTGMDTLYGNAFDDILIAGSTANDESDDALQAILTEWTSGNSYSARIDNIRNGGGANGAFVFDDTTVVDDGARDTLYGEAGLDWFWVGTNDRLKDRASKEQVN